MTKTRTFALAGAFALAFATLSSGAMAQSAGGGGGGASGSTDIQSSFEPPTTHAVPGGQTYGRGGAAPNARTIRESCHFDRDGTLLRCERQGRR